MLSRKNQEKPGILLPENWRNKIETVLYKVYQDQCDARNLAFQVHGLTYPDEFYLAVGLYNPKRLEEAPTTYIVSLDIDDPKNKEAKDPEKYLDTLIDSMGVFFDSYFGNPDWNDYNSRWTEASYKDLSFHYKVSRENVALTIQAEALLNQ